MAKIFLTKSEAVEWGLQKPKHFDFGKMKEKVLIRVLAGVIVFLLLLLFRFGGPEVATAVSTLAN